MLKILGFLVEKNKIIAGRFGENKNLQNVFSKICIITVDC